MPASTYASAGGCSPVSPGGAMTVDDGQPELRRKLEVPGVVGGDAHDRARRVPRHGVVGGPDGHGPAVGGVDARRAKGHAGLLALRGHALYVRLGAGLRHVRLDGDALLRRRERRHHRVLRREDEERHAEERVDAGGKYGQRTLLQAQVGDVEDDLRALAAADPVALHGQDALRPVGDAGRVEQLVGVVGDAQEPLVELAAGDGRAAPLAGAVQHLLVGEHRPVDRVPVDPAAGAVEEAAFEEVEEHRLLVAVIAGVAGRELAAPVDREPHRAELAPHRGDVLVGPRARVDALLHRRVLGRHAERVPAHRVQHVVALHPAEAGVGVRRRHRVPVADVHVAGGVGVHGQLVPLGARVVVPHGVQAVRGPPRLPLAVDGPRVPPEFRLPGALLRHGPSVSLRPIAQKRPAPRRDGLRLRFPRYHPDCRSHPKRCAAALMPAITAPPSGLGRRGPCWAGRRLVGAAAQGRVHGPAATGLAPIAGSLVRGLPLLLPVFAFGYVCRT